MLHLQAPEAPLAKMDTLSSRLAATDDDGLSVFGNQVVSSNPLIEICLLVPFPPPSTQGVSECTPPATSLRTTTLALTHVTCTGAARAPRAGARAGVPAGGNFAPGPLRSALRLEGRIKLELEPGFWEELGDAAKL